MTTLEADAGYLFRSPVSCERICKFYSSNAVRHTMDFELFLNAFTVRFGTAGEVDVSMMWTHQKKRKPRFDLRRSFRKEVSDMMKDSGLRLSPVIHVPRHNVPPAIFCWAHDIDTQLLPLTILVRGGGSVHYHPRMRGEQHYIQTVQHPLEVLPGQNVAMVLLPRQENVAMAA